MQINVSIFCTRIIVVMIASIMINLDKRAFYSYDSGWERTFFDERTGGFVVTELARKYKTMSKHDLET